MDNDFAWLKECPRREMVGFHIPDYDQAPGYAELERQYGVAGILEKVDPAQLVRDLKGAGVQAFWYYAKCHYGNAYYPSRVGHVHSAMKGRDLFGEFAEACLSEGIVPLGVYEFSDTRLPVDNPDWCHRCPKEPPAGADLTDGETGSRMGGPCLNGPYGDFVIEQTREIVRGYPIKGYYVDFLGLFNRENWRCPYCNEKFRREFGFDYPGEANLSPADYHRYIEWFYRTIDEYAARLRAAVKDLRPDVAFTHNFHGIFHGVGLQRAESAARRCDFLTADLFSLRDGSLQISWKSRVLASLNPARPAEALLDSVVCVAGDCLTPKAADGYRAELWTARCLNAATCASVIMNIDGTCDRRAITLVKGIYEEQSRYEPWLREMETLATVGLVRSHYSLEFQPEQPGTAIRRPSHALEFEGWAQALVEAHALWDVVHEFRLTGDVLKRFRVLILPEVFCLSAEQAEAVGSFVQAGGILIATGGTSLCDPGGQVCGNFQLADVLGVDYVAGRSPERRYLKLDDADILVFTEGQLAVKNRPGTGAAGLIHIDPAVRLVNAIVPTQTPGVVTNAYGRGRTIYFAGEPGLQLRCYGQNSFRRLLKTIIRRNISGAAPVELDAPDSVELFAHRQRAENRLVVNLVNISAGLSRSAASGKYRTDGVERFHEIETMPPIPEAALFVAADMAARAKSVYLAPSRQALAWKKTGSGAAVILKNLGVHTMIALEGVWDV